MAKVQRSTDIIEMIAERALFCTFGGVALIVLGGILFRWRGDGMFTALALVLLLFGAVCIIGAIYSVTQVKKVTHFNLICPFCEAENDLTECPEDDFPCVGCNRMIPIKDKQVMHVSQVRCGYCSALNYYCDKTEILICESCDHEIPISQEEDGRPTKTLPKGFAVTDDDSVYELVLTGYGIKHEEVISTLQHMLALNRNQVKDMLENLPATLLTGINRRKAEMLRAQLSIHGAEADIKVLTI